MSENNDEREQRGEKQVAVWYVSAECKTFDEYEERNSYGRADRAKRNISCQNCSRQKGVEMPITNEVYNVLFDDKSAADAIGDLMLRKLRTEIWQ